MLDFVNAKFRVLSEPEKAWLAAAIDGEGCIYFNTHRSQNRNKVYAWIEICNTNITFLENAKRLCGGGRVKEKKSKGREQGIKEGRYKRSYAWWIARGGIEVILPQILPYLIIKHAKAEACLQYLKENPGLGRNKYARRS